MKFNYATELLDLTKKHNLPMSEIMIRREMANTNNTREEIIDKMKYSLDIMKKAVKIPLTEEIKTMGSLIGGQEKKLMTRFNEGKSITGNLISKAVAYSVGVLEVNASMGIIVAAPTAGASGVIPGVFLALQEELNLSDEVILNGLFNASAVGYILMKNACVSGAEAGCQAEIGSASAMAASAVVEMLGGSPQQCLDAASTALQNMLGLVCDPVLGLVEVPCQSRNGMAASNSIICAEMALAGIETLIPFDEMVECMYTVGKGMPVELRETALGGCAKTPTACSKCLKF